MALRLPSRSSRGNKALISLVCLLLPLWALAKPSSPSPLKELRFELNSSAAAQPLRLRGAGAKQQLLIAGIAEDGTIRDLTREVRYQVSPSTIARVDTNGVLHPLADGKATVSAKISSGAAASLPLVVSNFKADPPINFANEIVPIFTKAGCNSGGCHGKSSGQNGFRLSLLGFEPTEDYEHLVKEARGRRIFPAAPDRSLLLLKATATVPHGGGKRLSDGSDDYNLLIRWIVQGMPYGSTNDAKLAAIEVLPQTRTMLRNSEQQLVVLAKYTDGSVQDVTRRALFEANEKELAKTTEAGRVQVLDTPGDVAVMVRYQAQSAVFRATIPLGAPLAKLPEAKGFIDELVFKKL
ncbi:MAG TPA: S-layer protein, partial [Verrucomicrobiae bacterium]|nr:S-layer protein [Verrucomicrobiae bacterium]